MKVLIAEDDQISSKLLERTLVNWDYEVIKASDGLEALHILNEQTDIPLLITDWMMPELDGVELSKRARQQKRDNYLYIIMLTAKGEKEDFFRGMEAGIDNFITKPFDKTELKAHLIVADRIISLEKQLSKSIEELTTANNKIKQDLRLASNIQKSLLPKDMPFAPGFEFSWYFNSCDEIGGDMFNLFRLDENNIGLYLLDVSGHGVQAALLSVSLSQTLNPQTLSSGILKKKVPYPPYYKLSSPNEVAKELNARFPVLSMSKQFFTFVYGILNVSDKTFKYVRCGHQKPILVNKGKLSFLESPGGLPIGMFDEVDYNEYTVQLSAGDTLILYTDGLEESFDENKEQFGIERIIDHLSINNTQNISEIIDDLQKKAKEFSNTVAQQDDITIVGFRVLK